ncbi:MAG: anti-sigma factor [Aquabacterium sp.]|uniref:anti-sigma factor n=1 Tax=Aquabacterium sp. TaxID=1872578 RepID=UPI0025C70821|nr:anti-sigma factor [Aquabacterium sp.]MBI5926660.1 anti-sigma factor [Aquabacterium sp.]
MSMKTYWHQHPDTVDRLAAEYAMGSMPAPARRRFEALMRQRQDIQQAVWGWHDTLAGSLVAQAPLPVDPGLWPRLASRVFGSSSARQTSPAGSWWSRWFGPVPSGMLAVGLALGMVLPTLLQTLPSQMESSQIPSQLPESYVGVLATANGQAGLVVSSLRKGLRVDIKQQVPVAVPQGQTLYLWRIDKAGQPHPVAAVPDMSDRKFVSVQLAEPAESVFREATELAVSLESQGSQPSQPSGSFVYRGLCGKVWQPPSR